MTSVKQNVPHACLGTGYGTVDAKKICRKIIAYGHWRRTVDCGMTHLSLIYNNLQFLKIIAYPATFPLLQRRLQKELMALMKEPPPGVTVDPEVASQSLMRWTIHMDGAVGTLYEGEKFELLFKFSPKYPFDSPEVTFQGQNIPIHPHVYSNGHICLSILTEDWSPALSVQAVCLSIISMLSSCKEKVTSSPVCWIDSQQVKYC